MFAAEDGRGEEPGTILTIGQIMTEGPLVPSNRYVQHGQRVSCLSGDPKRVSAPPQRALLRSKVWAEARLIKDMESDVP